VSRHKRTVQPQVPRIKQQGLPDFDHFSIRPRLVDQQTSLAGANRRASSPVRLSPLASPPLLRRRSLYTSLCKQKPDRTLRSFRLINSGFRVIHRAARTGIDFKLLMTSCGDIGIISAGRAVGVSCLIAPTAIVYRCQHSTIKFACSGMYLLTASKQMPESRTAKLIALKNSDSAIRSA